MEVKTPSSNTTGALCGIPTHTYIYAGTKKLQCTGVPWGWAVGVCYGVVLSLTGAKALSLTGRL